jgi:biopolymer transport protein ExbD
MAIFAPGRRSKSNRSLTNKKRNIVAVLSLTAMVDMFTVLTVFLLQNYKVTGEILHIPKDVQLPSASAVKELKPAHIVTVNKKEILLDEKPVAKFFDVKEQKDWIVQGLYAPLSTAIRQDEMRFSQSIKNTIQQAVAGAKGTLQSNPDNFRKVTVQADKSIDILTIKKIMATLTEAGASEINFAVIQSEKPQVN